MLSDGMRSAHTDLSLGFDQGGPSARIFIEKMKLEEIGSVVHTPYLAALMILF
jgi:hypothetical protein